MYSVLETAAVHTHTCTCMHNFFVVNKITHFAFFVFQNQNNHFPHVTRSKQNLKQNGQHQHHYSMNKTGKIGFGTKMNRRRQTESVEKYAQINSLERVNLQKAKNDTIPKKYGAFQGCAIGIEQYSAENQGSGSYMWNVHFQVNLWKVKIRDRVVVPRRKIPKMTPKKLKNHIQFF